MAVWARRSSLITLFSVNQIISEIHKMVEVEGAKAHHAAVSSALKLFEDPACTSMTQREVVNLLSERLHTSVATLGSEGISVANGMVAKMKKQLNESQAEGILSVAKTVFTALGGSGLPCPFSTLFGVLEGIVTVASRVMANRQAVINLAERFISLHPVMLQLHSAHADNPSSAAASKIVNRILEVFQEASKLIQRFMAPAEEEEGDGKRNGGWFGSRLVRWAQQKFVEISHSPEDFERIHAELDRALSDFSFAKLVSLRPAPSSAELVTMARKDAEDLQLACEERMKQAMRDASDVVKEEIRRTQKSLSAEFNASISTMSDKIDEVATLMKQILNEQSFESLCLDEHSVRLYGKLGEGGQGEILEADFEGSSVIAKCSKAASEAQARELLNEARLLRRLHQPNIVRCFGVVVKRQRTYIIMERCRVSIDQLLRMAGPLPPIPAAVVLMKVGAALRTLHRHDHVHRDIKARNVMLKSDGDVCLIDFGSAKTAASSAKALQSSPQATTDNTGVSGTTVLYAAPEIIGGEADFVATVKCDVYSFGMLAFELLSATVPFDDDERPTDQILADIKNGKAKPSLMNCPRAPPELKQLMEHCWSHDPDERPTMESVHAALELYLRNHSGSASCSEEYRTFIGQLSISGVNTGNPDGASSHPPTQAHGIDGGRSEPGATEIPNVLKRFRKYVRQGNTKISDMVKLFKDLGHTTVTLQELKLFTRTTSGAKPSSMDEALFTQFFFSWLRVVFDDALPTSGRPEIDVSGLEKILIGIGRPAPQVSLRLMMKHADVNRNNTLSFQEFTVLVDSLYDDDDDDDDGATQQQAGVAESSPVSVPPRSQQPLKEQSPPPSDSAEVTKALDDALVSASSKPDAVSAVLAEFAPKIHGHALAELLLRAVCVAVEKDPSPFATAAARQAVCALASIVQSAEAASDVGNIIRNVAVSSTADRKKLFVCIPVRDALAAASMRASTPSAAGALGEAISCLTADSDEQRKVFGTLGIRSALVFLIGVARAYPKELIPVLRALSFITINDDNEIFFGTPEVRSALVGVAKSCSESNDAAYILANAFRNLTVNEENKKTFGTEDVREALAVSALGCSSAVAVRMTCGALCNLSVRGNKKLLGSESIRSGILHMARFATTPESIRFLANAISNITVDDDNEKLFAVPEVRDALMTLVPKAMDALCVQWVATAIRNISANAAHKALMGTTGIRDALLELASRAISPEAIRFLCGAIANICGNDVNKQTYGTPETRESLVSLSARATTPESVRFLCNAFATIMINDDNEKLFGTSSVRDALVELVKHCTTVEASDRWCTMLRNFTCNADNKKLAGTVPVRDAVLDLMQRITTAEGVRIICLPLTNLTSIAENRKLFGTTIFREAMIRMAPYATSSEAVRYFSNVIVNITIDDDNEKLYATPAMRDVFLKHIEPHSTSTGDSVQWTSTALRNLCSAAETKALFATPEVRDAILSLMGKVSSVGACQYFFGFVGSLAANAIAKKLMCNTQIRTTISTLAHYAATSPNAIRTYANAIAQIAFDDDCEKEYSTSDVRDALLSLVPGATTVESVAAIAHAIRNLTTSAGHQDLFSTTEVRDALLRMAPLATNADAVHYIAQSLQNVSKTPEQKAMFGTSEVCDAIVRMSVHATSALSVRYTGSVISCFGSEVPLRSTFGTSEMRDAIIRMSANATSADAVRALAMAVANLTISDDVERCFATTTMRDAITTMWVPQATSEESVVNVCTVLRNLSCAPAHKAIFGTSHVHDAFVTMLKRLETPGCIEKACNAVWAVCNKSSPTQVVFCTPVFRDTLMALRAATAAGAEQGQAVVFAAVDKLKIMLAQNEEGKSLFGSSQSLV